MPRIPDSMIPRLRERMMKMKQAPEPDPVETERKLMNFAGAAMRNLLRKGTARKVIPLPHCMAALLVPKKVSCEGVVMYLHGGGYCTGDLDYACLYGEVLASDTGAVTFCPAYRLAPEEPEHVSRKARLADRRVRGRRPLLCARRKTEGKGNANAGLDRSAFALDRPYAFRRLLRI